MVSETDQSEFLSSTSKQCKILDAIICKKIVKWSPYHIYRSFQLQMTECM